MLFSILIQSEVAPDTIIALAEYIVANGWSTKLVFYCLCLNIIISIVSTVKAFGFQRKLKEFEVTIDRKKLINHQSIEIETKIFKEINGLSLVDSKQSHVLLGKVLGLQTYINENKLFVRRKLMRLTNDIIDYYSLVCTDFRKKDYSKETKLLDKYKKIFNE